jgi:hypothetical protein
MKKAALALALLLACTGAFALRAVTAGSQENRRATLEDLAWMEGRWRGKAFGGVAEEIWSAPAGGGMMGMFRLLDEEGKVSLYEFLLIEEDAKGLHLRFKHFGKGYEAWEKAGPLTFDLQEWTERRFQFASEETSQSPTHMLYARTDEDQMLVTVQTARPGQDPESFDVLFERGK